MTASKKKKIYFGIFWVVLITSFIFFATLLILIANGYHFNRKTFTLQKTAMLKIEGQPDGVLISLNGQTKTTNLPTKYTQLYPGHYDLTVSKLEYHPWNHSYDLLGGQAVVIENLTLFKKEPLITRLSLDDKLVNRIKKDSLAQKEQVVVKDNEIWQQNKLITRFSRPLSGALYDTANQYYFVQLGDEIHAIANDGTNDTLIAKVSTNLAITMSVNGQTLYYLEDTQIVSVEMW